jgi:hypothetical protein
MVLVRKTELACRDGWDHDLWEPKENAGGGGARNGNRPQKAPRLLTESHNSAWGQYAASGDGEDVVIAADSQPAQVSSRDDDSIQREQDSASAMNESPNEHGTRFNPRDAWSSAFRPEESEGAPSASAEAAVDELKDETVSPRFGASSGNWQGELRRISQEETNDSSPMATIPTPPVFGARVPRRETDATPMNGSATLDDSDSTVMEHTKVQQSGETEQFEVDPRIGEIQERGFGVQDVDSHDAMSAEEFEDVDEPEEEDPSYRQLPMVGNMEPCCRNCRDFLPAKDGTRGWCSNPFAFEQRKEVSGDTLACQSTFGNWWSPSDDWWMERADIAHHSAPTPLVDHLIRQIRTRTLEDEGSTEVRDRS